MSSMKQYHKALLLGGVLALAVVVTGCSAALPPDAQGPLWEEVVKGERANAARGGWTGIGLIIVGVLMMVGSMFPDLDLMARVGIPFISFLGITVRTSVPVGLAVVALGVWLINKTQYTVKVSTGEPEKVESRGRGKKR